MLAREAQRPCLPDCCCRPLIRLGVIWLDLTGCELIWIDCSPDCLGAASQLEQQGRGQGEGRRLSTTSQGQGRRKLDGLLMLGCSLGCSSVGPPVSA